MNASSQSFAHVRRLLNAALKASDPEPVTEDAVARAFPPTSRPPVLLAVGKAGVGMTRGALRALEGRPPPRGLIVVPETTPAPPTDLPFPIRAGGHPLPTRAGAAAALEALELVQSLQVHEELLLLLSGGGSALLSLPADDLTLEELRTTTEVLLKAGASIQELNTVRRHLERLKGGGLALAAAPHPVTALVISDVVGSAPEAIASGPVSPDPSTFGDALRAVRRVGAESQIPETVRRRLEDGTRGKVEETPEAGDPRLPPVSYEVVADVETAMAGAASQGEALGYRTFCLSPAVQGEARAVGRRLGALNRALHAEIWGPVCLVTGGETAVRVRGRGKGGRNQELVLAAALELDGSPDRTVASFGTDGIDGPTDAAGAVATGETVSEARRRGLDPRRALDDNDSYTFFRALDALLVTGPTGTNVMDVQLLMAGTP